MSNNTLSANTLFHFTRSRENIASILKGGFCPRLCMENQSFILHDLVGNKTEIAIPMVCFCDIPLSQIKNHVDNYGGYAIGLSKEWGKRNGINPVMYAINESVPVKILNNSLRTLHENCKRLKQLQNDGNVKNINDDILTTAKQLYDFSFYLKPYEGKRWNASSNSFDGEVIRFYDEREWRYIPELRSMYKMGNTTLKSMVLDKEHFIDDVKRNEFNDLLAKEANLRFDPSDINYIIVKSEDDVLYVEDIINSIMGDKYIHNEVRKLTTRILCVDRILEDF